MGPHARGAGERRSAHSAALLVHRGAGAGLEVLLGHMGGPYWARKDEGAWSIPKGEFDPQAEDPLVAARREFAEEIGVPGPIGEAIDLGTHRLSSWKTVHAFGVAADGPLEFVASNTFVLEWPPRSGQEVEFPEIDRAQWFTLPAARRKVVPGQVPILNALAQRLEE